MYDCIDKNVEVTNIRFAIVIFVCLVYQDVPTFLPDGESCITHNDCKSNTCSNCSIELRCGTAIGDSCKNPTECCSQNCVDGYCEKGVCPLKNVTFDNGESCFGSDSCKSQMCVGCPLKLRCGTGIGDHCENNTDCCTQNCVNATCQKADEVCPYTPGNGGSCFSSNDCKSNKCSSCPVELLCGTAIGEVCENDNECCTQSCEGGYCQEATGI